MKTAIRNGLLAIALVAMQCLSTPALHAGAPIAWNAIQGKNGECQISFPSLPQVMQQKIPVGQGGKHLFYDMYVAPFEEKGLFLLLVATYPEPIPQGGQEVAGLQGLVRGILGQHPENRLVFGEMGTLLGHPSVSFLIESKTSYFRGQALVVGNKLFLIAMEGIKGSLDEAIFKHFVKSFQLTK